MRNSLLRSLAAILLIGPLLSQTDQQEPFSLQGDKLGMSLEDFKAKHVKPGLWEDEVTGNLHGGDFHSPPRDKGRWKWKPALRCKESFKGVITECEYRTSVGGGSSSFSVWVSATAVFVEGKLGVITLDTRSSPPLISQALLDKYGSPVRVPGSIMRNRDLVALRWDNGISVIQFQEKYCGKNGWKNDVATILRGTYCDDNEDVRGAEGEAYVTYVHKSLYALAIRRSKEVTEEAKNQAMLERFTFDDKLGMSLNDLKAKWKADAVKDAGPHNKSCEQMLKTISNCEYSTTIRGVGVFEHAIFVDDKLAAIYLSIDDSATYWTLVDGIPFRVYLKQALINAFGLPEIIPGYPTSTFTDVDRRTLHWDKGGSVVDYELTDCQESDYGKIVRVLQKRYCESNRGSIGFSDILCIDKALSSLLVTRWKKAEEDARQKARSDM